jgi:hypothetical protein
MKPNLLLQARMQRLYERFKQSQLTRTAFCREEGITAAQFTYWCRRFEQESTPTQVQSPPITLAQVSTPIQAVKEPAANPVAEPSPSFTQLHLSEPLTTPSSPITPTATPMMIVELGGKGRIEFYMSVEAGYRKALLS